MKFISVVLGFLLFGWGVAILDGAWASQFITRDGAQTVGTILFVGGIICVLIGGTGRD